MIINGYYADVPELSRIDELKLVCLWRKRWAAAGWEPRVLSEWEARKHPYFHEYDTAIQALPCVNPKPYEVACFHRWLALCQVGGGYMADFDCIVYPPYPEEFTQPPFVLETEDGALHPKLHIYQTCAPAVAYASAEVCLKLCQEFAKGTLGEQKINDKAHFSDMYMMEAMGPDLIERHDVVKGYGDPGWETAPFVHYSAGSMAPSGKVPKWKWIPKLRP
jgi:hypothetical protein